VSADTPKLTRAISFAACRRRDTSTYCTPLSCANVVQSSGANTVNIGPNGDWSVFKIGMPRLRIASTAVASAPNSPSVNAVPGGNGAPFTASPNKEDCSL
jgi:hypothetical protein